MNAFGVGISPIRLLLVDCQPTVRRLKMRLALEEDLEVVGEACDAAEAIPLARDLRPDVVLMDFEMPGMSGVAATEGLRAAASHSAVVIFTLRDVVTRERARAAGAAAFVAKHQTEELLLAAIRGVAEANAKQGRHDRAAAGREEDHGDDSRDHRSS